jgi:hypothetical protein
MNPRFGRAKMFVGRTSGRPVIGGNVKMFAVLRSRVFFVLIVIVGLLVVASPDVTEAASRQISVSTYQSGIKCDNDGGESVCAKNGGYFTLLQVKGTHFTPLAPYMVTVIDTLSWTIVSSGSGVASSQGTFLFKTQDVEVCNNGTPVFVQVYDLAAQTYSNVATALACDF